MKERRQHGTGDSPGQDRIASHLAVWRQHSQIIKSYHTHTRRRGKEGVGATESKAVGSGKGQGTTHKQQQQQQQRTARLEGRLLHCAYPCDI